MAGMGVLTASNDKVWDKYLNFDQIADFKAVADTSRRISLIHRRCRALQVTPRRRAAGTGLGLKPRARWRDLLGVVQQRLAGSPDGPRSSAVSASVSMRS